MGEIAGEFEQALKDFLDVVGREKTKDHFKANPEDLIELEIILREVLIELHS